MKIWEINSNGDDFDYLLFQNHDESKKIEDYSFDGKEIEEWIPLKVKIGEYKKRTDILSLLPGILIINSKTLNVLNELIKGRVQVLSAEFEGSYYEKLFILNILDVRECIDYEKAIVKRFKSSNRIMRFVQYAFKEQIVESATIFKIPEHMSRIFATDTFRDKVLENGILGLDFNLVWDSEKK